MSNEHEQAGACVRVEHRIKTHSSTYVLLVTCRLECMVEDYSTCAQAHIRLKYAAS